MSDAVCEAVCACGEPISEADQTRCAECRSARLPNPPWWATSPTPDAVSPAGRPWACRFCGHWTGDAMVAHEHSVACGVPAMDAAGRARGFETAPAKIMTVEDVADEQRCSEHGARRCTTCAALPDPDEAPCDVGCEGLFVNGDNLNVERCDTCKRFEDDQDAANLATVLINLLHAVHLDSKAATVADALDELVARAGVRPFGEKKLESPAEAAWKAVQASLKAGEDIHSALVDAAERYRLGSATLDALRARYGWAKSEEDRR